MANEQNLIHYTSDQDPEEARRNGAKGGKASGESRRRKKLFRESFEELLARGYTDANGNQLDGTEILAMKVFRQALDGDLKAFEIIRDTTGQKPADRIEAVEISREAYEAVMAALEEE